jgi:hypothetical protein
MAMALLLPTFANAADTAVQIKSERIIKANYDDGTKTMRLRLRPALRGHAYLGQYRKLHLTAYDASGLVLTEMDQSIGKRQTYAHFNMPAALTQIASFTVNLH